MRNIGKTENMGKWDNGAAANATATNWMERP
jgi:hypothetical protein